MSLFFYRHLLNTQPPLKLTADDRAEMAVYRAQAAQRVAEHDRPPPQRQGGRSPSLRPAAMLTARRNTYTLDSPGAPAAPDSTSSTPRRLRLPPSPVHAKTGAGSGPGDVGLHRADKPHYGSSFEDADGDEDEENLPLPPHDTYPPVHLHFRDLPPSAEKRRAQAAEPRLHTLRAAGVEGRSLLDTFAHSSSGAEEDAEASGAEGRDPHTHGVALGHPLPDSAALSQSWTLSWGTSYSGSLDARPLLDAAAGLARLHVDGDGSQSASRPPPSVAQQAWGSPGAAERRNPLRPRLSPRRADNVRRPLPTAEAAQRSVDRLTATAKAHLLRRLLRTERVQGMMQTVRVRRRGEGGALTSSVDVAFVVT
jgi:hypothetical protein